MSIRFIVAVSFCLLIAACSGNTLFHKTSEDVMVSSIPAGASVIVMRHELGLTPVRVGLRQIFPVTFADDEVDDYGRITLKKAGCEPRTLMVNATMISQGANIKLDCTSEQSVAALEASTSSIKKRLQQLQALRDDDLISEKEFEEIRQRILQEL